MNTNHALPLRWWNKPVFNGRDGESVAHPRVSPRSTHDLAATNENDSGAAGSTDTRAGHSRVSTSTTGAHLSGGPAAHLIGMPGMTRESGGEAVVVGSRVVVRTGTGSRYRHPVRGVVIEDYADEPAVRDQLGGGRAPVRRWAIVLDDGRLVFADDGDVELDAKHLSAGPGDFDFRRG
ncbi:hypothetical protein ACFWAY_44905 [Rhodococcus sp. NPDC059968]|uniref:hypothetical protein n=1 Tax=Rhodococcus sp. NPDC059968 TaxID=3347017 RepID=UPI00366E284C